MKPEAPQENPNSKSNLVSAPGISLPKGGGAIKGIGEKFSANPVTGTGSMSVPIALSPGRGGFGPQLSLSYDSGAGQGVFGLGWQIAQPCISRKTDKGLPRYLDEENSDVFLISGAEDLVPVVENGIFKKEFTRLWGKDYVVLFFRPRIEGLFAHIEYWVETADKNNAFWRSISRDNITIWYGLDENSRIFDPDNQSHIYQWLICKTYDDKGNLCEYKYTDNIHHNPGTGHLWESNRLPASRTANRYLKYIFYGNRHAYQPTLDQNIPEDSNSDWMFEVVFDYGDHDVKNPKPRDIINTPNNDWAERIDAFSQHRAGFEIRTDRLCRRILMFHHFPEDEDTQLNYLVKSTDFNYELANLNDPAKPGYTVLQSVIHRAYQKRAMTDIVYESRQFPPVTFSYSQPNINKTLQHINLDQLENLPIGIQGNGYRWLDLDGEGLSGVLAESTGGWYYKPGLGDGSFGAIRSVAPLPVSALAINANYQFMDLAGNGEIDVVDFSGATPGFYARDQEQGWKQQIPFLNLPNINWQDPNLRFLDLTGDGHADALITEQDVFTWYPSLDERGFDKAEQTRQAIDEDVGPRLIFADVVQTIFLADMCGDGLTDLVRIRNGEICYWPNLGYGKFGRKVTLGNSPQFDLPDLFDSNRIRLADIDGSGPIDIIYLGRQGAQLYFNRSGNALSHPITVDLPLTTVNLSSVQVADLFGNGTACLVWSSHLPADAGRPVCYIDLMGGSHATQEDKTKQRAHEKPHLLIKIDNNVGLTTEIEYTPSTRFYLQDKLAGVPWVTRLPFPVYCVSKTITKDKWRGTVFSSAYSYHHGYFDGAEREFRGFGRVEQIDAELFSRFAESNIASPWITQDKKLYQPPVKTITWYHTGAALDRQKTLTQFAQEYFPHKFASRLDQGLTGFRENSLVEPELPQDLTAGEWREALRACKGMVLRQESYELDLDDFIAIQSKHTPVRLYSATNHNCHIRCLQKQGDNRHAVFLVTENEALRYHYELAIPKAGMLSPDPRISHTINLRHDQYGNSLQSIVIAYKRWKKADFSHLPHSTLINDVQAEEHIVYNEIHYTNDVMLPEPTVITNSAIQHHRLRVSCETQIYELKNVSKEDHFYYSLQDFRNLKLSDIYNQGDQLTDVGFVPYHQQIVGLAAQKRIVEHTCTRFFDDHTGTPEFPLAFGKLGPRGFKYEDYQLALTTDLLDAIFTTKNNQGQVTDSKLTWSIGTGVTVFDKLNEPFDRNKPNYLKSGYIPGAVLNVRFTGQYWMRSGIAGFAQATDENFYLPDRYTDPFGSITSLEYDPLGLFVIRSQDAKGNIAGIFSVNNKPRFNYRVLAPIEMVDANGNQSEVVFDIRGLVVVTATKGKRIASQWQGDNLDAVDFDLINPPEDKVSEFCFNTVFYEQQEMQANLWLANASVRFIYHFGEARDLNNNPTWLVRMPGVCSIAREIHAGQSGGGTSPLQISLECSDGAGAVVMKKVQAELDPNRPPPTLPTDSTRRWIINGLTLLNNKGKPVKQYEPAFSDDFGCEMPQAHGVSSTIFYDAVGRVVRTEFPDGTFSCVEFSPWFSRSFDQNDSAYDPINQEHSDWYLRRTDPSHLRFAEFNTPENQRAANLIKAYANTPAEIHFDSLGREVISIAHNRSNGVDEKFLTFTKLDAEGKPLWIRDARGNLVMQYIMPYKVNSDPSDTMPHHLDASTGERIYSAPCYDMAGNLLFQHSMDADDRWMLSDAAGQPMFAWDIYRAVDNNPVPEEQRLYITDYDSLHRPIVHRLKIDGNAPKLIETFIYQDAVSAPANNLNGQITHHYDASGLNELVAMDFKGSPLEVRRTLVADKQAAVTDWQGDLATKLEGESWVKITRYDALKRMTRLFNWHSGGSNRVAVYEPHYNERGVLKNESLILKAIKTTTALGYTTDSLTQHTTPIVHITNDAKGQRQEIILGNGTRTQYHYDAETFRLKQLRTSRPGNNLPFPDHHSNLIDNRVLQQLNYTYDATGNIIEIYDEAYEPVFFQNTRIEARNQYEYDALYRLIKASGKEDGSYTGVSQIRENNYPESLFPIASANALRNYSQLYSYDAVGNILKMEHQAGNSSWTRYYTYAFDVSSLPASNRLISTQSGNTIIRYEYDSHGSMLNLDNVPDDYRLQWDHRDMITKINLEGGGYAHYQYDTGKQRTRKLVLKNNGNIVEERIYLGGLEIYRRTENTVLKEEIETLHLFDGEQRLLMVDQINITDSNRLSTGNLYRYIYSNHLGSSNMELDDHAQIISYEEYHPYGTSAYQAVRNSAEAKLKRYRYTGMERDEESGLSYHSARYYLPWLGRWGACDPVGIEAGLNNYRYCGDNPICKVDRNGAWELEYDRDDNNTLAPDPALADSAFGRTINRAAGGAWGATANFLGFLRLGLYDSWSQTDDARTRNTAAGEWFQGLYCAIDESRFMDWAIEGVGERLDAIERYEAVGDSFAAGEVFGDTAMTTYTVGRATIGTGLGVTSLMKSGPRTALYGVRHWATTYDGIGIKAIPEARINVVRGFDNYAQYLAARTLARYTAQAQAEFAAGQWGFLPKVRVANRLAGTWAESMWRGNAIEAIVNEMVALDPLFDSPDFFVQGRLNVNASGNVMKPDFGLVTGEDIGVFDITSTGQAGKVGKYVGASTAVDILTGTSRPSVGPSAANLVQFHRLLDY
jgi:RHS repeat-associated protein